MVDIAKQGFTAKKFKDRFGGEKGVDCVVIGSGLSGLCTAALLSRANWKVTCPLACGGAF
jgi:monoamine oxidase